MCIAESFQLTISQLSTAAAMWPGQTAQNSKHVCCEQLQQDTVLNALWYGLNSLAFKLHTTSLYLEIKEQTSAQ